MLTKIFTKKKKNITPVVRPNDDEAWDREFKFLENKLKCNKKIKESKRCF
tara:strand:+ start:2839 stop:2988 length:150 start_codon:yes stop_codon:yes gene_type:complete